MDIFKVLLNEFLDFFRLGGAYAILTSGHYSALKTIDGIIAVLTPLAPFIIFGEMFFLFIFDRKNIKDYKMNLWVIFANRILTHLVGFSIILLCYGALSKYAFLKTSMTWYWFIYAYIFYELGTFVYHFTSHKVRILWCFHSIHHSTETLNASVTLRTFYLENVYTEFVKTSIVVLAGVSPIMYFLVMSLDAIWGAFVHISDKVLKDGRLGVLEKFILTPSHHRVHHGRNLLYLDTNYCAIISIWDRLFGTYQEERKDVPIEYGLNREIHSEDFRDVYFGEFPLLWKDIKSTKSLVNKIKYVFMPPGWSPEAPYATAKYLRREFIEGSPKKEGSLT